MTFSKGIEVDYSLMCVSTMHHLEHYQFFFIFIIFCFGTELLHVNASEFWMISWFSFAHTDSTNTISSPVLVVSWAVLINNNWMRLSVISWIIKTEVCVIYRSRRLRQIIQTRGFHNSWYHAKTEFNNCFVIHYLNNRQKKTFIC